MHSDTLPDGNSFAFWNDETEYTKVYHVAQQHPKASDDNPGTEKRPFKTISRAAEVLEPGEKVIVHEGVYRECVQPARGGTSPRQMTAYEAAEGEQVVIKGSEVWQPEARPSEGCRLHLPGDETTEAPPIWMADLPAEFFHHGYNPFLTRNVFRYLHMFALIHDPEWKKKDPDWLDRTLLRRGMVFVDGLPLKQVINYWDLSRTDCAFWVEDPGTRLHFRLPGGRHPSDCLIEITTREQAFAPLVRNLGYVKVKGFRLQHTADGIPVPQRGCLSTSRGHHWLIEDNHIEWANATGMDIGAQTWEAAPPEDTGHHIVRRNTIRHCGICGIAGAMGVEYSLIEENVIEQIGHLDLERMWECAGIKFHFCKHSLIRRNVFRHIRHAQGIWLDCGNENCRITNNVFHDIETVGAAVYSEMNYDHNLVDGNLFWDIRNVAERDDGKGFAGDGAGVKADCNEKLTVAHNFFGNVQGYAVAFTLNQSGRKMLGRTGLCWANAALNNVFFRCPHRVLLGRRAENKVDGNLYDAADSEYSFTVRTPEPACLQNLAGWREFFGLDEHSSEATVEAEFDADSLALSWRIEGETPLCRALDVPGATEHPVPGPFNEEQWRQSLEGKAGQQAFPTH